MEIDKQIIENARKLEELEAKYIKLMYETKRPETEDEFYDYTFKMFEIGKKAFDIRNEIVEKYPYKTNLQIHDENVKTTLDKIRHNGNYYSISFFKNYIEVLENKTGKSLNYSTTLDDFLRHEKYDELFDDFFSGFNIATYYFEIMRIGPIVSSSHIPEMARQYFDEIRHAYAFELFSACIALCRAMLEMCLFDKLRKKGYFKESKIVEINMVKEDKLHKLIGQAKREHLLNSETQQLAHKVRFAANKIIHPRNKETNSEFHRRNAFDYIQDTVKVIEYLYK